MYPRVRRYFKTKYNGVKSNADIFQILKQLFENDNNECDELKEFRTTLDCEGLNFQKIESTWWQFIPFLYNLQKYFTNNTIKSFKLAPIFTFGRKHVQGVLFSLNHYGYLLNY